MIDTKVIIDIGIVDGNDIGRIAMLLLLNLLSMFRVSEPSSLRYVGG